jgi:hypothetical protein
MSTMGASTMRGSRGLQASRRGGRGRGGGRGVVPGTTHATFEPANGDNSQGRHCHSTLSLTVIGCHSLGIQTVFLLALLLFSAKMTVSPVARRQVLAEESARQDELGLEPGHRAGLTTHALSIEYSA